MLIAFEIVLMLVMVICGVGIVGTKEKHERTHLTGIFLAIAFALTMLFIFGK